MSHEAIQEMAPPPGIGPGHRAYLWIKQIATHKVTTTIVSVLALIVSRGAAYVSQQTSRETARLSVEVSQQTARSDMLNAMDQDYNELSRIFLDHPAMSYLYETNAQDYAATKRDVLLIIANKDQSGRAQLRLQEEATADFIFTTYQHRVAEYYQIAGSEDRNVRSGDPVSADLLRADLDWFEKRLLHNPRLLWMWKEGGYGQDYNLHTQNAYRDHVIPTRAELSHVDKDGPFVDPKRSVASGVPFQFAADQDRFNNSRKGHRLKRRSALHHAVRLLAALKKTGK
jgi:hypothetical protein